MTVPAPLLITVNGLPAHPLIVHGAVVLIPLAALLGLGYVVGFARPAWRAYLRWPLVGFSLLAVAFVWASVWTGGSFQDSSTFLRQSAQVEHHAELADVLSWVTTAFVVVAVVLAAFLHQRSGRVRTAAAGLMGVLAIVTLVYVGLTGDAGARAVYGSDAAASAVSTR